MLRKTDQLITSIYLLILLLVFPVNASAISEQQRLLKDQQLFSQAVQLSTRGDWGRAEQIYRDLLTRNSDWPEPRNNLAILLFRTNRIDEAKQMLEQAVSASTSYRIAQNNRTQLYNYLASQAYDKALGVNQQRQGPALELIREINQPVKVVEVEKVVEKKVEVVVEKPVVKPVTKVVTRNVVTGDFAGINDEISRQLAGWARAWTLGNVDRYLQTYSSRFVPDDERKTLDEWKNIRQAKLRFSEGINVNIRDIRVFVEPQGDQALVEFVQDYQSATYSDKVLKQLYMQKEQGNWLILSERVIKTY